MEEERTSQTESGIILNGKDSVRTRDRRIVSAGTSQAYGWDLQVMGGREMPRGGREL